MKEEIPIQLNDLVDVEDAEAVFNEIEAIVRLSFPRFDMTVVAGAYDDVLKLFRGQYPGYRGNNVSFHDLTHTLSVVLAMARLMDGATAMGHTWTEKHFNMGLISALMHDTGYIQRDDDTQGT
ncbi:MAG: hypothetical protein N2Z74_08380, partial [Syntrophales bacterium]|nr:hypothetical protein [Syntrophales bacterium]